MPVYSNRLPGKYRSVEVRKCLRGCSPYAFDELESELAGPSSLRQARHDKDCRGPFPAPALRVTGSVAVLIAAGRGFVSDYGGSRARR